MAFQSKPTDLLSTLAPELLVQVIAELPLSSFLDLKHTSTFFRNFLKNNASTICNHAIRTRFPYEEKLLQSALMAGWLMPTHPWFANLERFARKEKSMSFVYFQRKDVFCKDRETKKGVNPDGTRPSISAFAGLRSQLESEGRPRTSVRNGGRGSAVTSIAG